MIVSGIRNEIDHAAHKQLNKEKNWSKLADQCMEESAELIVALRHYDRGRIAVPFVIEEMADVIICIDALLETLPAPDAALLKAQIEFKIQRMNARLHIALGQLGKVQELDKQMVMQFPKQVAA